MKLRVGVLVAALGATQLAGCSIMDPDDRQALRDKINGIAPMYLLDLRRGLANEKVKHWLEEQPQNDEMGNVQCRVQADGKWGEWLDQHKPMSVADMLDCLELSFDTSHVDYLSCADKHLLEVSHPLKEQLMNSPPIPGGSNFECKFIWDFRYDPKYQPKYFTDPSVLSIDEMIDELVAMPAPPPGFPLPELAPLLCPLGAGDGWGCPDKPDDPNGGGAPPPGGG